MQQFPDVKDEIRLESAMENPILEIYTGQEKYRIQYSGGFVQTSPKMLYLAE